MVERKEESRRAIAAVRAIRLNDSIPAEKAISELTSNIETLQQTGSKYYLAQAYAIRGRAFACGAEDHESAFREWRIALRILLGMSEPSSKALRLRAWVRFQMGLHSEGAERMRSYNLSLQDCNAARSFAGTATVLVHRGLEWRDRGDKGRARLDLSEGLVIARKHRVGGIRDLKRFIAEVGP